LRRIFLPNLKNSQILYVIDESSSEFHHIKNVLRGTQGDIFEVFNGKTLTARGEIKDISKRSITIECSLFNEVEGSNFKTDIAVSIIKPENFTTILNSAVQLGINNIYPFVSEYSYLKNFSIDKIDKWNRTIIEASKQSRNNFIHFIEKIYTFNDILSLDYLFKIYFNSKDGVSIYQLSTTNNDKTLQKLIVVGPEGGFSDNEINLFNTHNFTPIKLSTNTMRTEVASIVTISIIKYISGEL